MQEYASSSLTVMDLNSGEQRVEEAGNGQKIRALGFINEDLIYGLARDEDIVTDAAGNTTFAMHNVRIQNFEGEIVKEYQQDGIWVSAAVFPGGSCRTQARTVAGECLRAGGKREYHE